LTECKFARFAKSTLFKVNVRRWEQARLNGVSTTAGPRNAKVVKKPFIDPKKEIPKS
jgi:hypothetical protein